jgi:hypothetical protein
VGWRNLTWSTGAEFRRYKTIADLAQDARPETRPEGIKAAFLNGARTESYGLTAVLT